MEWLIKLVLCYQRPWGQGVEIALSINIIRWSWISCIAGGLEHWTILNNIIVLLNNLIKDVFEGTCFREKYVVFIFIYWDLIVRAWFLFHGSNTWISFFFLVWWMAVKFYPKTRALLWYHVEVCDCLFKSLSSKRT